MQKAQQGAPEYPSLRQIVIAPYCAWTFLVCRYVCAIRRNKAQHGATRPHTGTAGDASREEEAETRHSKARNAQQYGAIWCNKVESGRAAGDASLEKVAEKRHR